MFAPESDASAADIPIFILGTVFGILLHQREQIVLHASAVRVNGKAVLFCGPSGAGKSTLAAALAQHGYPLVTDDFCTIALNGSGPPLVHPDGRQLKLWAQAIERLDLAQQRGERVRKSLEKFYVEPAEVFTEPLAARRGLCAARGAAAARARHRTAQCGRCRAAAAAQCLSATAGAPPGQQANYFHAATAIANVGGIFHLTRALDFAKMPDVIALAGASLARTRSDGEGGMTRTIWLASYPKSGNTWFRMLVANLSAKDDKPVDINDLPERGGIASARGPFDYLTLIDSGLLTHDEIDLLAAARLRGFGARRAGRRIRRAARTLPPVRFVKVHDAYTLTPKGEPLLAGAAARTAPS